MRGRSSSKTHTLDLMYMRAKESKNVLVFTGKRPTWRDENAAEQTVLVGTQLIIIFRRAGESEMDVQRKLDRWRAGQEVEDVVAGPLGTEEQIRVFRFVDPRGQWWEDWGPTA